MRVHRQVGLGFFILSVFSLQAWAAPTSLIVRFRAAQDSILQKSMNPVTQIGIENLTSGLNVVNGSEGVVQLKFDNQADAAQARAALESSGAVLSVAADHWYRPLVHYSFRETQVVTPNTFLSMPLLSQVWTGHFTAPADIPAVELPPTTVTPGADPLVARDWAMKAIDLPSIRLSRGDSVITAAVIDTGVNYNHEDLSGAMWRKPGDPHVVGYDFAHDNARPYDVAKFDVQGCLNDPACRYGFNQSEYLVNPGHGTHCAGHIAAVYGNSLGIRGVGAGSKLIAIKGFYDAGEPNAGAGDDAALIKGIDYAIANGAKVISASWGGREAASDAEDSELKQALIRAQKAGVLVVVAAGNDGIDNDTDSQPDYPATYDLDNIISVAATDQNDQLAEFSSYGATSVDIGAPGVKIFSTTSDGGYNDVIATYTYQGKSGEMDWDGTSMATPIVAGAAALIWSKHPNENYHQIRDRILNNARKVPGLSGKVATGGVLDVAAAIR